MWFQMLWWFQRWIYYIIVLQIPTLNLSYCHGHLGFLIHTHTHTHKIESWSHRIIIPAQIESIRFLWTVDKGIHTHDSKFPYILFHIKLQFFKFKLFLISKFSYFPTKKKLSTFIYMYSSLRLNSAL